MTCEAASQAVDRLQHNAACVDGSANSEGPDILQKGQTVEEHAVMFILYWMFAETDMFTHLQPESTACVQRDGQPGSLIQTNVLDAVTNWQFDF